ncbi:TonB-dependent receptor [Bacteroides sp. BFG-638]|uniref:TonB-dependent receptor n=1 Tax=Bacteroides vicugnae TaxID=3037989 RepID=A0ABU5HLW8_9BACE|nr:MULTISPECIES: TonB-dependent receptor [unclassified Bacteroides]MCS2950957.1 TonB-dependent receptor [Bacteroides sp. BFG-638]MCS3314556.1 TonB-dependent receptor [Bacteroides sp. BFG-637]MDY7254439.1 TonB-dependent receptor [Bacteroides sp. A1-P5]MDY7257190.1 TonB-dependent receptor [Bacteroides sp. A2-P53]
MRNDLKKTQAFRYMLSVGCLLFFFSIGMFAQQQTVKGVVKDVTGEPIIGASVLVKGTNNGTITNLDGAFSLSNVEEGVEIEITYVGYLPQIVKATIAPLNIILREDTKTLDEIVVIGYGTQKKSVVTASIAKVSSEDLSRTSPTRVDNALKGLAAGVQVTTLNGQPGASSRVRVRGIGTINNSDPLYIIDGMPVDGGIDNINPADIASIEVLKDAASGAVYGARAANGVVLVTTKKGSIGKTKVSYDFSYGWQSAWKKRDMLNATQYATLMNEAADYAGEAPRYEQVASLGSGTNWQDALFYDNAPVQNHQLSISGASEKVNYYFSLGYYDQDGIIGGNYDASNYQRLSLRSNTMYTLFDESEQRNWLKKMTFSMNIAYSRVNSVGVTAGSLTGSPLGDALFMDPTMSVYAKDESELQNYDRNTYGDPIYDKRSGQLLSMPSSDFNELANPLARLSLPYEKNNSDKIIATLAAELSVWDHLKYKFSWGSDLAFWGKDGWNHPYYLNKNATNDKSKVWSEMNRGYTWQIENVLTYDKTFGVHSFAVVLGQSAKKYTGRGLKGDAMDMIEYIGDKANLDFTTGLQSAGKRNATGGAFDPTTLASYFGRLSYNYDERYMLQVTVRRDGSSNFGPNNKWATFPSVSLGWNITNEKWMDQRPSWLTNTKLRLSWGKNGNENIGAFRYMANVAIGNNYVFGTPGYQSIVMGSKPSGTPNKDLKWEESEQYDAGLDFGFFNNALTFTVDYFYKKTNGMLKEMSIPSYLGESKPWGNVGSMKNEGVELELGYKFNKGDWNFGISANASYLKNELINLGNADGFEMYDNVHQIGNVSRAENGMPYPYFYGYKTNGIFQNKEQIDAYVNDKGQKLQPNAVPGDVIFVDFDKNGEINDKDKTMIGKGTPDWTFGLNLNASWKNIDFSMLLSGAMGQEIMDVTRRLDCRYVNLPAEFMNRWHGEGTSNTMPRFSWANNNDNWRVSDLYVHNGSYARIKNIQLGYTLPSYLTQKIFIQKLRFYVAAENLLTMTSYKGLDPELNGDERSNGIDRGYYPQARTFTVGVNLNF